MRGACAGRRVSMIQFLSIGDGVGAPPGRLRRQLDASFLDDRLIASSHTISAESPESARCIYPWVGGVTLLNVTSCGGPKMLLSSVEILFAGAVVVSTICPVTESITRLTMAVGVSDVPGE